jgi:hypothetical protein
MVSIESEIRTLREKLSKQKSEENSFDESSVDEKPTGDDVASTNGHCNSPTGETNSSTFSTETNSTSPTFETTLKMSTTDLSELERSSLRRTRLQPRRFRQINCQSTDVNVDVEDDLEELDDEKKEK